MAEWKKVIVSGSDANLASLQVDNLITGVVTGSSDGTLGIVSINGTGSILATTGATGVELSGSFSGSFFGDGGGLTNISASSITGLNLSMIATGSVTASVNVLDNAFTVASESIQLFNVRANGGVEHGSNVTASGAWSHAEGTDTQAIGSHSHAEGDSTQAIGDGSHAEGQSTTASGSYSHAEGHTTLASGLYSHAKGEDTVAYGYASHAEGELTIASGSYSHAEGRNTQALGQHSHTEGTRTVASGGYAHAEGSRTTAEGWFSHAEGNRTIAIGTGAHAEGYHATASGNWSHAEGTGSVAYGTYSHAEGISTIASGSGQLAAGRYNTHNNTDSLVVIGNGTDDANRSDLALFNSQSITFNQPVTGSVFSGSFYGTFSGTTDLPDLTEGTGVVPFIYDGSSTATVAISGAAALSNNTLVKWDTGDGKFLDTSITDDGTLVTFSGAALFQGDITVEGTASFQNTENLLVSDRFVLFASGSNTAGDGGIVVQQGVQNVGELFGYENSADRWGFTSSFDASSTSYTPAAFVAAVVDIDNGQSDIAQYQKNGNIKIDTGDIWIYA